MENPKCWARSLGDCSARISGEHLFSTTVWELPKGVRNTRKNRVKTPLLITQRDANGERVLDITAQNHVANILCEHHNAATTDLDIEAGNLTTAFRAFFDMHMVRFGASPQKWKWHGRRYTLNGLLVERWLMKTGINHLASGDVPIGAANAEPGMPSPSLVRMVYGLEAVPRHTGIGMFGVEHPHVAGDGFELSMVTGGNARGHTHVSAIVLSQGMFHLGLNFERREMMQSHLDVIPWLRGGLIRRPLVRMNSGATNVEIRFAW